MWFSSSFSYLINPSGKITRHKKQAPNHQAAAALMPLGFETKMSEEATPHWQHAKDTCLLRGIDHSLNQQFKNQWAQWTPLNPLPALCKPQSILSNNQTYLTYIYNKNSSFIHEACIWLLLKAQNMFLLNQLLTMMTNLTWENLCISVFWLIFFYTGLKMKSWKRVLPHISVNHSDDSLSISLSYMHSYTVAIWIVVK